MDLHLSDKIAVVTGASKGIGLAITQGDGGRRSLCRRRITQPRTRSRSAGGGGR